MLQIVIGSTYGFNPRTYIRYDSPLIQATDAQSVSIHVPI